MNGNYYIEILHKDDGTFVYAVCNKGTVSYLSKGNILIQAEKTPTPADPSLGKLTVKCESNAYTNKIYKITRVA